MFSLLKLSKSSLKGHNYIDGVTVAFSRMIFYSNYCSFMFMMTLSKSVIVFLKIAYFVTKHCCQNYNHFTFG